MYFQYPGYLICLESFHKITTQILVSQPITNKNLRWKRYVDVRSTLLELNGGMFCLHVFLSNRIPLMLYSENYINHEKHLFSMRCTINVFLGELCVCISTRLYIYISQMLLIHENVRTAKMILIVAIVYYKHHFSFSYFINLSDIVIFMLQTKERHSWVEWTQNAQFSSSFHYLGLIF